MFVFHWLQVLGMIIQMRCLRGEMAVWYKRLQKLQVFLLFGHSCWVWLFTIGFSRCWR